MAHSIRDIATALAAEAEGDLDLVISRACEPSAAGAGDLALAMDPRYGDGIAKGKAQAALLWPGADWRALGLKAAIFAPRGRLAMAGLTVLHRCGGADWCAGAHRLACLDRQGRADWR
jgi:UDP-3-O-[3-hydroxymyristoyl] glucosamine N-acyltransferase